MVRVARLSPGVAHDQPGTGHAPGKRDGVAEEQEVHMKRDRIELRA
jgi:hypothetical protein